MAKLELSDTISGYNLSVLNDNFQKIETELKEKVVYRDEVSPMERTLDMDGNKIINLGNAVHSGEAVPLNQLLSLIDVIDAAEIDPFIRSELADTSGASLVGYLSPETGAINRTVEEELNDLAVSVKRFGAVGDGVADDTAAIQAALNASVSVFLPTGNYRVTSTITFPNGRTLHGNHPVGGYVNYGFGSVIIADTTATVFVLRDASAIKNIGISYPNYATGSMAPVVSDYTIKIGLNAGAQSIDSVLDGITVWNAYNFLFVYGGRTKVDNIFGRVVNIGLFQKYSGDISRFSNVHFMPVGEWVAGNIWEWTLANGTGFIVGESGFTNDATQYDNCSAVGFDIGFLLRQNSAGKYNQISADVCNTGCVVLAAGTSIANSSFTTGSRGSGNCLEIGSSSTRPSSVAITGCHIISATQYCIKLIKVADLSITGCTIARGKLGNLLASPSTSSDLAGVVITGNIFVAGANSITLCALGSIGDAVNVSDNAFTNYQPYTSVAGISCSIATAKVTNNSFGGVSPQTSGTASPTGTFTPTYKTTGVNIVSATYPSSTGGYYSRVGDAVFFTLSMQTDAMDKTGATGNVRITGLPITAKSGLSFPLNAACSVANSLTFGGSRPMFARVVQGTADIELFYRVAVGDNDSAVPIGSLSTGASANIITVSGVYPI